MLGSSSETDTLQTLSAMLLPHPHRKQQTCMAAACDDRQEEEKGPLVVIIYVAGMSKDIRHVCRSSISE